jgi:phage-related protein
VINVEVTLKSDTAANFQTLLDTFKKKLRTTEGYLDIIPAGTTEIRRIKATVTSLKFGREYYNITFISKIKIQFTALEPFFYAKTKQSYDFLSKTADLAGEVTNAGSVDSLPVFYIIGSGGCAITSTTLTAFGKSMVVVTNVGSGDVLIIDSETKSVTKNGVAVDYTGFFPIFPPGSNPFVIDWVGTIACDVTMIQSKNYL